jgi:hypothetical protein
MKLPEPLGIAARSRIVAHPQQETDRMADDKSKRGGQDRKRVAGGEGYEVSYFARKHGLSTDQARDLIKQVGNDREKLNAAAQKMKGKG